MTEGCDIDFAKLLGFETISDRISGSVDFQAETLGAKLGAKVGGAEPDAPSKPPQPGVTDG